MPSAILYASRREANPGLYMENAYYCDIVEG